MAAQDDKHTPSLTECSTEPDPLILERFGVQTRDEVDMRNHLTAFFAGTGIDPTDLIQVLSGRRVHISELLLTVVRFSTRHKLGDGQGENLMTIIVLESERERLTELLREVKEGLIEVEREFGLR